MYDMQPLDQEKLVDAVRNIVEGVDIQDAVELMALVQGNPVLKAKIVAGMFAHLHNLFYSFNFREGISSELNIVQACFFVHFLEAH